MDNIVSPDEVEHAIVETLCVPPAVVRQHLAYYRWRGMMKLSDIVEVVDNLCRAHTVSCGSAAAVLAPYGEWR